MSSFAPPFQPGDHPTNAAHACDLGKSYRDGARTFVVCKATSQILAPAKKVVASALAGSAGAVAPTWSIDVTTTAADKASVGIIPAEYTATIAAGDYLLVQTGGPAIGISAAAIASGVAIGSSTTGGSIDDASAVAGNELGVSLEAVSSGDIGVLLTPRF